MWTQSHSVIWRIAQQPRRYDFFQAVRLVESAISHDDSHKESMTPKSWRHAALRFRTQTGFSSCSYDIEDINIPINLDGPAEMTVAFFGLTGTDAPLPYFFTEKIIDEEAEHGEICALREFLDMFNHRLLHLKYDVRAWLRPGYLPQGSGEDALRNTVFLLIGLAPKAMRNRLLCNDQILFRYTGLLHGGYRSLHGLEVLLSDYFSHSIYCQPLTGYWRHLEEEHTTRIGSTGHNQTLGRRTILGQRMWDQETKFTIRIEVMDWEMFTDFLPTKDGQAYQYLTELVAFYLMGCPLYDVIIRLRSDAIPENHTQNRLGWNSILAGTNKRNTHIEIRYCSHMSPSLRPDDLHKGLDPDFANERASSERATTGTGETGYG